MAKMTKRELKHFLYKLDGELPEETSQLLDGLVPEDSIIRSLASSFMFDFLDDKDEDSLIKALLYNPDSLARADAAFELSETKSSRSISALISSLTTDRSPLVRFWCAQSLGDSEERELIPFLLWFMSKNRSPETHLGLCYATCRLGHKPSLEPLANYLLHEDYWIRQAAAFSLLYLTNLISKKDINKIVLPALGASLEIDDCAKIKDIHSEFKRIVKEKRR